MQNITLVIAISMIKVLPKNVIVLANSKSSSDQVTLL